MSKKESNDFFVFSWKRSYKHQNLAPAINSSRCEFLFGPYYCPSKTVEWMLRLRMISAIMNFYWSHAIALQKLSNERSYKFSWILTLTEVISIRILRMRIISAIMNIYWSHAIPLQKRSNERSYKFSWILTQTPIKFRPSRYLLTLEIG